MVDIVVTISPLLERNELNVAVDQCTTSGIKKIRINVAKIFDEESEKKLLDNILFVKKRINNCSILLDCAYPRLKSRIHIDGLINIKKDKEYFIQKSDRIAKQKDTISVDNLSDELFVNQILYYGDGEGGFQVVDIEQNKILVRSICDFTIYDSKTITNSNLYTNESYDSFINRLCNLVRPEEVAFSFVEESRDLSYPLELKDKFGFSIVCKIETEKGIRNLKRIASRTDKIMIGRGDLGLYSDITMLYQEQIEIFKIAKSFNKNVYVATDIMESLNRRYLPSRADIIDASILYENEPEGIILNYSIIYNYKLARVVEILKKIEKNCLNNIEIK